MEDDIIIPLFKLPQIGFVYDSNCLFNLRKYKHGPMSFFLTCDCDLWHGNKNEKYPEYNYK